MKKRVYLIAAVVSGALAVSGCTTNPYTGEREAGKSAIGAGLGSLVGAGIGALSSSKKDRGKGALIGAAAIGAVFVAFTGNFKIYSINKMVARELGNYLGGSDLLLMLVKLFATDVVREITSDNKKEPDGIFQCIVANGEINNQRCI